MLNSNNLFSSSSFSDMDLNSALKYVEDHPYHVALGVLGTAGALVVYKAVKDASAFSNLDGPASPSFLMGTLLNLHVRMIQLRFIQDTLLRYSVRRVACGSKINCSTRMGRCAD
jgi:hypothetical protein